MLTSSNELVYIILIPTPPKHLMAQLVFYCLALHTEVVTKQNESYYTFELFWKLKKYLLVYQLAEIDQHCELEL